ncbi:YrdB family protein [Streptomyces sp. NPDC048560]|uniref:YrdB family protein n=1 Tax=Streptomyces sp. NPDC048560 TaxID=3155488 RepID=UPI003448301A
MARGPWFAANEVLALFLELGALICLGWWGFSAPDDTAARVLLGVGTPAAAITLWALFAAPRARITLPLAGVLAVKALVLGGGALAVYGLGYPTAAVVLAVVLVGNTGLSEFSRHAPTDDQRPEDPDYRTDVRD